MFPQKNSTSKDSVSFDVKLVKIKLIRKNVIEFLRALKMII